MIRSTGALCFAAVLWASPAAAGSVSDTLREFGLFGTWAVDCDAPPSPDDNHAVFSEVPPAGAQELIYFSPQYKPNTYAINSAERVGSTTDQISLGVTFGDDMHQELILLVRNDTIRTMWNIAGDGSVRVKDGTITSNGGVTHSLTRCRTD